MARELWVTRLQLLADLRVARRIAQFTPGPVFAAPRSNKRTDTLAVPKQLPTPRRRCPFPECPSHDDARLKGVVRHSYLRSRNGARLRLLCRACGRTFCSRRGTAYYRLQHPRSTFDQFADLLAEGLSAASLSRALGVCPAMT
jgi:hypothetical protein